MEWDSIFGTTRYMEMAPFFIVGADRSGTTLLRLMLNEHSELHVPRESWFLSALMDTLPMGRRLSAQEIEEAFDIIRSHERWVDWEISDERLGQRLRSLTHPSLADVVDAVFRLSSEDAGKEHWGDKTPAYIRDMDRLGRLCPRAKFIHVIRDVRDVCLSLSKVGWHGQMYKDWARYWSETVEAGIGSGHRMNREQYMEVRYECLLEYSMNELRRVCQFLDVPFERGMLKYHQDAARKIASWERRLHRKTNQPPRPDNAEKWRRELSGLQVLSVEAIADRTMKKVGQARVFSGPAHSACLAWRGVIRTGEWSLPVRRKMGIHFTWLRRTI